MPTTPPADDEAEAQDAASPQDSTGPPPPTTPLEAAYWAYVSETGPNGIRMLGEDMDRYNAHYGPMAFGRDYDLIVRGGNQLLQWKLAHSGNWDENGPKVSFETIWAEAEANAENAGEDEYWRTVKAESPPKPLDKDFHSVWNAIVRPRAEALWRDRQGSGVRELTSFSTADLLTHAFEAKNDLIAGLIPGTGLRGTIANAKVGKTAFGMQQAICVGAGIPFMGRETQQGRVLFIEEEGAPSALQYRLQRMIRALEFELRQAVHPEVEWLLRQQTDIATDQGIDRIRRKIEEYRPSLIVWGPLSMIGHLTNENDAAEMQKAMRNLLALAADYDISIDIAHHRKKVGKDAAPNGVSEWFDTIRGSSALLGAVDIAVGLDRKVEDEYGRLFIISRDGPAQILGYRFDSNTLLHFPEETVPKTEDKAPLLLVRDFLRDRQRVVVRDVEAAFGVSRNTALSRLEEVVTKEWAYRIEEGGRKTHVYVPRNYEQETLLNLDPRPVSERLEDLFDVAS